MKPTVALVLLAAVMGCGGSLARMDRLDRVQVAVLTDANALAGGGKGFPPVQIADPDRIAAVEAYLKARHDRWEKVGGTPRAMRFQLQLVGDNRPLYTVWFEPGYAQGTAGGKDLREMRLSNADLAELFAALGLPPDYQAVIANASTVDYGPPRSGVAKEPTMLPAGGLKKR